jgi:hypothetical protein
LPARQLVKIVTTGLSALTKPLTSVSMLHLQ